jgi:hypothetical protein
MVDKMKLFKIGITAWGSLGFYRGVQSYNFNYNYNNNKRNSEHYYRYSDCIWEGFRGSVLYLFPYTTPYMFLKEMYRLETNIRNKPKFSDYYDLL